MYVLVPVWSEEGVRSPGAGLQVIVYSLMLVPRIELGSSARAGSALNFGPSFQSQRINIFKSFSTIFLIGWDQTQGFAHMR